MDWFRTLLTDPHSGLTSALILGLVVALGLAVGSVKVFKVRLGAAAVVFVGIAFAHFGLTINEQVLEFTREFGLILFVYTLGMAVGPGLVNALKAHGLRLNLLAALVVLLGVGITLGISLAGRVSMPIAVGIFSGATTNTPSLAAANQAMRDRPLGEEAARAAFAQVSPAQAAALTAEELEREVVKLPGLSYAVCYPVGITGIILTMIVLRRLFGVDPVQEAEALKQLQSRAQPPLARLNIKVLNPNLVGRTIEEIPALESLEVVISRLGHEGAVLVAQPSTRMALNDVLLAVGKPEDLDELRMIVGAKADVDLAQTPSDLTTRWLTVTRRRVVGEEVDDLRWVQRFGVQVTRLRRAEVELPLVEDVPLQMGDRILAVGPPAAIKKLAHEVGDSPEELQHPELVPFFLGIVVGIVLGSIPFAVPGVPAPVKLGLAVGPLVVAIVLSRVPRIGPLVWYLTPAANYTLRELGLCLFLAAVGLRAGDRFVATLTQGQGLYWLALAVLVTVVPLVVAALVAFRVLKIGFVPLLGLLAGSMTDPPALAFAHAQTNSELPSVAYATVYPLTMILRVLSSQLLVLVFS